MLVYTIGTFLSLLFCWISINLYRKRQYYREKHLAYPVTGSKVFALLSFVPLTAISAIRYGVGTDFSSYWRIYSASGVYIGQEDEPFFVLFVRLLNMFSRNPQLFFAVTSIIFCGVYFLTIYRHSQSPMLSIALFVLTREYFRSMNGIRQYLALAVLLLALPALENNEWKKALVIIAVAILIHNSAIFFLALLILSLVRLRPATLLAGAIAAAFFASTLREIVYPIITRYTRFSGYFSNSSEYSESVLMRVVLLVDSAFFLLLIYLYHFQKIERSSQIDLLLNSVFLGVCVCAMSTVFPRNVSRFSWYTDALIVIYTPTAINAINDKFLRHLVKCVIVTGYSVMCFYYILNGNQDVLPYVTFWK